MFSSRVPADPDFCCDTRYLLIDVLDHHAPSTRRASADADTGGDGAYWWIRFVLDGRSASLANVEDWGKYVLGACDDQPDCCCFTRTRRTRLALFLPAK